VVNVFNGSSRSLIKCQINGLPAVAMKQTPMQDPFFAALSQANRNSYKWDTKASISEHMWTAPMPGGLLPGMHVITVETTDQHGNIYRASSIFDVK
jgi:hypothetical protein